MALKKSYRVVISCFVITIACLLSLQIYMCFTHVHHNKSGTIFDLQAGTSKKQFITQLSERGIIPNSVLFSLYVYLHPGAQLKSGEYFFSEKASLYDVWRDVTVGSGLYYHAFTIVPGWSFKQLKLALSQITGLKPQLISLNDEQLMHALGEATKQPEGLFFPDTYFYTKGDSDKVILQKAHHLMQLNLQKAWLKRSSDLPYANPYEALIAASLVEKEARMRNEYKRIAGVLVNRLRKGMLLQFDPTVIYAMGDQYVGRINKADLQISELHNTYMHKGLPPTPIAMPGLNAIEAALNPEEHDYYYFVARGDGTHIFSKTLEEHHRAVNEVIAQQSKVAKPYFNSAVIQQYLN